MIVKSEELIILGGGLAGASIAGLYEGRSVILEREATAGGLCRSYQLNGVTYDVGPHIMFSKNKEILDFHCRLVETNRLKRANNILLRGRWIKYPFENDLSALEPADNQYCLDEFLNNPYENYAAENMQQFFLKTFGEGITRLYLGPYNEKIWKFDPSCLDTQMVERIPKPPREDVIKSSRGISTEGYVHQLYFHYPKQGGIQSLFDAYLNRTESKTRLVQGVSIKKISKAEDAWNVETNQGAFRSGKIVNCMPLHELFNVLDAPEDIQHTVKRLLYNSIHIVIVQTRKDNVGERFAVYVPEKDIIFHRLSKLNFLGEAYCLDGGGSTLMAEITFRPGTMLSHLSGAELQDRVVADLIKTGMLESQADVLAVEVRTFKYAYVIYDLDHRRNTDKLLNHLRDRGIHCLGRFAEFEYLNTDQVAERAQKLGRLLNEASRT